MFAIIETGGKQYKVTEGDFVFVEKLNAEEGATVEFPVLAISADDGLKVGSPVIEGAKVTANVVKNGKAKKIYVKRRSSIAINESPYVMWNVHTTYKTY